jgi:hypothetical protein
MLIMEHQYFFTERAEDCDKFFRDRLFPARISNRWRPEQEEAPASLVLYRTAWNYELARDERIQTNRSSNTIRILTGGPTTITFNLIFFSLSRQIAVCTLK